MKRFDDSAPIKPKSTFDLNFSTAISAAGLIATYLVILVQFKQSNIDFTVQKWKEETNHSHGALVWRSRIFDYLVEFGDTLR